MNIVTGDLWDYAGKGWIVVPTILTVLSEHRGAWMNDGVAAQARAKYEHIDRLYAQLLLMSDGFPQVHLIYGSSLPLHGGLIMLPTREYYRSRARLSFIENGLKALSLIPVSGPVYLPYLGCGFGGLDKAPVLALMLKYLSSDRFTLVERGPQVKDKYPESFLDRVHSENLGGNHDKSLVDEQGGHDALREENPDF